MFLASFNIFCSFMHLSGLVHISPEQIQNIVRPHELYTFAVVGFFLLFHCGSLLEVDLLIILSCIY